MFLCFHQRRGTIGKRKPFGLDFTHFTYLPTHYPTIAWRQSTPARRTLIDNNFTTTTTTLSLCLPSSPSKQPGVRRAQRRLYGWVTHPHPHPDDTNNQTGKRITGKYQRWNRHISGNKCGAIRQNGVPSLLFLPLLLSQSREKGKRPTCTTKPPAPPPPPQTKHNFGVHCFFGFSYRIISTMLLIVTWWAFIFRISFGLRGGPKWDMGGGNMGERKKS